MILSAVQTAPFLADHHPSIGTHTLLSHVTQGNRSTVWTPLVRCPRMIVTYYLCMVAGRASIDSEVPTLEFMLHLLRGTEITIFLQTLIEQMYRMLMAARTHSHLFLQFVLSRFDDGHHHNKSRREKQQKDTSQHRYSPAKEFIFLHRRCSWILPAI